MEKVLKAGDVVLIYTEKAIFQGTVKHLGNLVGELVIVQNPPDEEFPRLRVGK